MIGTVTVILLFIFVFQEVNSKECQADQKEDWSYSGKNGPRYWYKRDPACNGINQSPINIDTYKVIEDNGLKSMEYINYDKPLSSAHLENNGHSVEISPTDGVTRRIQNGGLLDVYNLTKFHFHWGSRQNIGAEHRINNRRRFEMEMHLVHSNSKDELAVVGVFFQETITNNTNLASLVKALKSIQYRGDKTTLQSPLSLADVLPQSKEAFYRYIGSLTIPPCTEGVVWSVLVEPVSIGTAQMKEFRNLRSTDRSEPPDQQCNLDNNYRPIQKLNNRIVSSPRTNW